MGNIITEQEFRSSQYGDMADNVVRLGLVIDAVEEEIAGTVDRRLPKAEYTEIFLSPSSYLFVQQYPVRTVTSLRKRRRPNAEWEDLDLSYLRYSNTELPLIEYIGSDLTGWEIEVVYEAGYDPIPADLKLAAIKMTAVRLYVDIEMFGVGDSKEPGIDHEYRAAQRMLKRYKRPRRFY